ncbi:MAG: hypothetical protein ACI8XO_000026 [Verrucomicrobiales bacterium]|jgi:hypothetical protein
MSKEDDNNEVDWVYRDSTKKGLMIGLYVACGLTILAEVPFWLFGDGRETHGFDWGFGFYPFLGFVSCTIMIFVAKGLSFVLKKPTGFYDDEETGEEEAK